MLKIQTFPRVHISLIGMNNDGYRINGGLGFSISSPTLSVIFKRNSSIVITDNRSSGLSQEELFRLRDLLIGIMGIERFKVGIHCIIQDSFIQPHMGFGSSSMIYLSCVEALFIINDRVYTNDELVELSSRGGTSGVGINTYFNGGFVFDTGVKNQDNVVLAPSSSRVGLPHRKPLVIKSFSLPPWELGICIPRIRFKTEEEERVFFKENCPIDKESVEEILYEAVYGITSALIENDYCLFCNSIDAIQHTRWKQNERNLYGDALVTTEQLIRDAGANCVGMSSLGPMLYFFGNQVKEIVDRVKQDMPQCVCFQSSFNNLGRQISDD